MRSIFVNLFKNHSDKGLDKVLSFGEILSTLIIADYFNDSGTASEQLDARGVITTDNNFGNAFVLSKNLHDRNYCRGRKNCKSLQGF